MGNINFFVVIKRRSLINGFSSFTYLRKLVEFTVDDELKSKLTQVWKGVNNFERNGNIVIEIKLNGQYVTETKILLKHLLIILNLF
jgi:hypothetical protein